MLWLIIGAILATLGLLGTIYTENKFDEWTAFIIGVVGIIMLIWNSVSFL